MKNKNVSKLVGIGSVICLLVGVCGYFYLPHSSETPKTMFCVGFLLLAYTLLLLFKWSKQRELEDISSSLEDDIFLLENEKTEFQNSANAFEQKIITLNRTLTSLNGSMKLKDELLQIAQLGFAIIVLKEKFKHENAEQAKLNGWYNTIIEFSAGLPFDQDRSFLKNACDDPQSVNIEEFSDELFQLIYNSSMWQ